MIQIFKSNENNATGMQKVWIISECADQYCKFCDKHHMQIYGKQTLNVGHLILFVATDFRLLDRTKGVCTSSISHRPQMNLINNWYSRVRHTE